MNDDLVLSSFTDIRKPNAFDGESVVSRLALASVAQRPLNEQQ